ncbi:MAG: hypothetical protein K2W33_08280, partial [Burkholderiales bacterium]|nr:hypothetical protein [Burkholderiales bacterium]
MVAALSLVVASMTNAVKQEIRFTGQQKLSLQWLARADAAVVRVLQQLKSSPNPPDRLTSYAFDQFGAEVWVSVTPLGAYLDLNKAPRPLFKAFLKTVVGLADSQADFILDGIDARRKPLGPPQPQRPPFEATEDLMQIPGITMEIYRTIQPLVTAYS